MTVLSNERLPEDGRVGRNLWHKFQLFIIQVALQTAESVKAVHYTLA
jgi:hypothetical protein